MFGFVPIPIPHVNRTVCFMTENSRGFWQIFKKFEVNFVLTYVQQL
jgi:hypothetical protein